MNSLMELTDLGEPVYRLTMPIQVMVEAYSDGSAVARFPEVEAVGIGQSAGEAVIELQAALVDLYDELTHTDPASLGALPTRWRSRLRDLIQKL